jgi:ribosome maturation factor RimP
MVQQQHAPRSSAVPRPALARVVETTVTGLGYDLADCEVVQRGRLVRVFIDRPESSGGAVEPAAEHAVAAGIDTRGDGSGVTVDDCERVTRQLQRVFEVEGIDYDRLEVSSPGMDRALRTPAQFRRFVGSEVEVRLRVPQDGRKRFAGVLRHADDADVEIEVDGARRRFAIAALEKARLVPKF